MSAYVWGSARLPAIEVWGIMNACIVPLQLRAIGPIRREKGQYSPYKFIFLCNIIYAGIQFKGT